ncbi:hypothetical protein [Sphingomonas sp.]|jgi:hypothetical protein|uniref:PAS domain-containing protein n=1 Tax=Sphingomonas sp. TaxID=28214 RepID=UPI002EDB0A36
MDTARGIEDGEIGQDGGDAALQDQMFALGGDERRMHVRAYNHWVSLLNGRPYPAIADLDPDGIVDFGPHSVLLDFTAGIDDPGIAYLGRALRSECGLETSIGRISDVPSRSLLSRLTDHYLQIIANCAPIGFEAEFVGIRDRTTLYRGILMPFSSDGEGIDFIYGVINWKEVVDPATQATLDAELDAAMRVVPRPAPSAAVWADGPGTAFAHDAGLTHEAEADTMSAGSLGERLAIARESAAAARAADTRSRSALYRALGRAHDFAIAADADQMGYEALLSNAGITAQLRAPMTPIAKLVFGVDYDKTRLTEYAAVLQHAHRNAIPAGGLGDFIDGFDGGIKAVVAAERRARKPVADTIAPVALADRAAFATIPFATKAAAGSAILLVARVAADGMIEVVGSVPERSALIDRAVRALR